MRLWWSDQWVTSVQATCGETRPDQGAMCLARAHLWPGTGTIRWCQARHWWPGGHQLPVTRPGVLESVWVQPRSEWELRVREVREERDSKQSVVMGFCSAVTLAFATIFSLVAAALLAIAFSTDNWITITVDRDLLKVSAQGWGVREIIKTHPVFLDTTTWVYCLGLSCFGFFEALALEFVFYRH